MAPAKSLRPGKSASKPRPSADANLAGLGVHAGFPRTLVPPPRSSGGCTQHSAHPGLWTGAWRFSELNMCLWKLKVGVNSATGMQSPHPRTWGRPINTIGSKPNSVEKPPSAQFLEAMTTALWACSMLRPCPQEWDWGAVLCLHLPAGLGKLGQESLLPAGPCPGSAHPQPWNPVQTHLLTHWPLLRPEPGPKSVLLPALDPKPGKLFLFPVSLVLHQGSEPGGQGFCLSFRPPSCCHRGPSG